MRNHFRFLTVLIFFALSLPSMAQTPTILVQFANPENSCATLEYCLDVEFKSDLPDIEVFAMNVRFFYDDDVLEFVNFRDFQGGYGPVAPNPPLVNTSEMAGPELFNFGGAAEFINGAIQRTNTGPPPIILDTDQWTKLYRICFLVENPEQNLDTFCPSIVWDLEADPALGGFLSGDDGVVITMVDPDPDNESLPTFENVVQYNWEYIGDGAPPYGQPFDSICIDVNCALPIAWASFSGRSISKGNLLEWETTASNDLVDGFEIERSNDAFVWEPIGFTEPQEGAFFSYQFLDERPKGLINYYRVVQLNLDGEKQYSGILKLGNKLYTFPSAFTIYPNPVAKSEGHIYFQPQPAPGTIVRLFNPIGQLLHEAVATNSGMDLAISHLASGMYLIVVDDGKSPAISRVVIY